MRIAYLVSRFPAFSETFVLREALEVRRLGHDVQVYALKSLADEGFDPAAEALVRSTQYSPFFLSAALLWANLKTAARHPVKYCGSLLYVLAHSLATPKECLKALVTYPKTIYYGTLMVSRGVEHIHAHFANIPTLSALIISRIWGIPFSFAAHAHDLFTHRSMLREKLASARFAVTCSDYNRKFVRPFCREEDMDKFQVLHCGADVERLQKVVRRPDPGLIGCVSRLSAQKGFKHLVEACDVLRKRGVSFRCILAGEGPEQQSLADQARALGLAGIVELPGRVPDVGDFLSRLSVLVLPCVQADDGSMDGLPTVLIEAMAARIPVISAAVSGIPELVRDGETGLLVPQQDPAALADAIERLLKDPALAARLAENGHRLACDRYDLEKSARRVAGLFEQCRLVRQR
jgi:glycosyltransferase involved in cell wall biosynthesis